MPIQNVANVGEFILVVIPGSPFEEASVVNIGCVELRHVETLI